MAKVRYQRVLLSLLHWLLQVGLHKTVQVYKKTPCAHPQHCWNTHLNFRWDSIIWFYVLNKLEWTFFSSQLGGCQKLNQLLCLYLIKMTLLLKVKNWPNYVQYHANSVCENSTKYKKIKGRMRKHENPHGHISMNGARINDSTWWCVKTKHFRTFL